jgi:sugar O-acyltransferase (sialic acid O-acetyltransferase NeuD family)
MKKIILFGNGFYAESVYLSLLYDSSLEISAFTVDRQYLNEHTLSGLPVAPFEEIDSLFPPAEHKMLLPLSYQRLNRLRAEKYHQARAKGYEMITYISSRSTVCPDAKIGDNCLIGDNVSIGPRVVIGNDVTIGPNAVIGHHVMIGDHNFISAGAVVLGGAGIGPYCLIGANATINEGVSIAGESLIASGVTITNHTREKGVYLGSSPELLSKPSDEVSEWLTWPVTPRKSGSSGKANFS